MADLRPSEKSLIALARILAAEQGLDKTLRQVLDLVCAALGNSDEGAITLLEREGPRTAVATSDAAIVVDNSQYVSDEGGPCLQAYRQQRMFRIDSTVDDQRWPDFSRTAAEAGFNSTLSAPLVVGGDGLGALNIYRRQPGGFSADEETLASSFASYASVALANARDYWRTQRLAAQLEEAMATRGVIEQAKGVLMASQGCSVDGAFQLLVGMSQHAHVKLHDLARDLVETARQQAADRTQDPRQS